MTWRGKEGKGRRTFSAFQLTQADDSCDQPVDIMRSDVACPETPIAESMVHGGSSVVHERAMGALQKHSR